MSKKNKFDLTALVRSDFLKDGEQIFFVSDPSKTCSVKKQPNGEFKLMMGKETVTIHSAAQALLGQEPPGHASRWFRNKAGKTLYELWQSEMGEGYAEAA